MVILCRSPETGRREIEEIVEEMEERDREERGTGMKVKRRNNFKKKKKKKKHFPATLTCLQG